MYWLDPDGGSYSNTFLTYCDMTSYNGGWTMCYTTDEYAKPSVEVEYNADYLPKKRLLTRDWLPTSGSNQHISAQISKDNNDI